jgi:predicted ferric reductase
MPVFVAGGVGITPLLAQVGGLLGSGDVRLRVIWGLRAEDLGLAVEVLERNKGLGKVVRLFVSGQIGEKETGLLASLEGFGAVVERRRVGRDDVLNASDYDLDQGRKYYLCVGPELQKVLAEWLDGEEVVSESFNY